MQNTATYSFFRIVIIFIELIVPVFLKAQPSKRFSATEKLFVAYFNQTRLSKRIGLWTDFHHRTIDKFFKEQHQSIARIALSIYANDNLRFMSGYAFVYNYHNAENSTPRIEHRPWQQLFFKSHFDQIHSIQTLRLEQRYIQQIESNMPTNNFAFLNRIRYSQLLLIPFKKEEIKRGHLFGVLNNEIFINFGKNVKANVFDQNRAFVGVGYQFAKATALHAGYMHIVQQLPSGNDFIVSHCIRIFIFQNFNLRKTP